MALTVLKITGQVFCRMSIEGHSFDVFIITRLKLYGIGKKTMEVKCHLHHIISKVQGFPGGTVVENLPANVGDMGSSPGLGGSHMPRSN